MAVWAETVSAIEIVKARWSACVELLRSLFLDLGPTEFPYCLWYKVGAGAA